MPLVGAHVSTAGGLTQTVDNGARIGAEVLQIFSSNPRQWAGPSFEENALRDFGQTLRKRGLPLFLHTIYLVNLASPDPELRRKSAVALGAALRLGSAVGAGGVVTHIGSHRGAGVASGVANVAMTVSEALTGAAGGDTPPLLLEVSAGSGQSLGRTAEEMGRLLDALRQRGIAVGVCLDTAHLFAAGFPVHERGGIDSYLASLTAEAGPGVVGLIHLNDSRSALGSKVDRHENLWEGHIGRDGLSAWLNHPALVDVPFVLEVPGFAGRGPDRKNLRRAWILRGA